MPALISVLIKLSVSLLLFLPYVILVGMTAYPLFALGLIAINGLYSWIVIWAYADLKAQNKLGVFGQLLFIPLLMGTGTLGFIIWLLFQPEARRKRQYQRD